MISCLLLLRATCTTVPLVDLSPLLRPDADTASRRRTVAAIGDAAMNVGFLYVSNHGVSEELHKRLDRSFRSFVAQPRAVKRQIEMAKAGSSWRGYFEVGEELTKGLVDQKEGFTRYIKREPVGVVFVVAPWNYPYLTSVNSIIPALLAGNSVVLKHSAQTPLCAERLFDAFEKAGLKKVVAKFVVPATSAADDIPF